MSELWVNCEDCRELYEQDPDGFEDMLDESDGMYMFFENYHQRNHDQEGE